MGEVGKDEAMDEEFVEPWIRGGVDEGVDGLEMERE